MPPEATLANDPAARTETGAIKDQTAPAPVTTSSSEKTEPEKAPPAADKPADPAKTDKSLLNDGDKKPEAEGEKKPEAKATVPEKYEFKLPEGFTLDEPTAASASELFKKHGLPQEAAQELVDFYAKQAVALRDAPMKAYQDMRKGWRGEVKADPVIGGKLDQVKTTVAKAIDGLGDAKLANDFRDAMDLTGAGDNPAFIRVFYRLAQAVTEGKAVSGNGPAPVKAPGQSAIPSAARALYPNLP